LNGRYTVHEATWEGKDSFANGVLEGLIRGFKDGAEMEGKGKALEGEEPVLLQEALNGGWKIA
jgi:hypothetical protein